MIAAAIARIAAFSARRWFVVIAGFLLLALASGYYLAENFAITTDADKLLSEKLPWRQQEFKLANAFPQRNDLIVAVIDGATPEGAEAAAKALSERLAPQAELFRSVRWPAGDPFFARNALLFETPAEVDRDSQALIRAQPFLGALAADPSLRGVMTALSQAAQGVRVGEAKLADLQHPMTLISEAIERANAGADPAFSWRPLISGHAPEPSELRQFLFIQPKLDFSALQPGQRSTDAIRAAISSLGLTLDHGVRVRLT
ncbi:MAG: hopanoid biosynthesis-associated RND transporter HpnN, partial [Hyphomicrobiales bacterium]|nr:hopanoid biosynthesis-associated RND transporter HpnN [Hyphomicrobiales bacterium]